MGFIMEFYGDTYGDCKQQTWWPSVSFRMTFTNKPWMVTAFCLNLTPFSIHEPKMYAQKIYQMWDRPLLKNRRPSPLSDSWAPHFPATVVKCAELAVGSEWKMVAAGCWSVLKSAQSEFGRARSKHGLKSQNKTALMKTKKSELSEFGSARQLGLNWKLELFHD